MNRMRLQLLAIGSAAVLAAIAASLLAGIRRKKTRRSVQTLCGLTLVYVP